MPSHFTRYADCGPPETINSLSVYMAHRHLFISSMPLVNLEMHTGFMRKPADYLAISGSKLRRRSAHGIAGSRLTDLLAINRLYRAPPPYYFLHRIYTSHLNVQIQLCNLQCSTSSSPSRQGFCTFETYCKDLPAEFLRSEALTPSPPVSPSPFPHLHLSRF